MSKLKQAQAQLQASHDEGEEYWRRRIEELGVKFDEIVVEILKEDFRRRSDPYEPIIDAISQYLYDVSSKLYGLVDEVNEVNGDGKKVLLVLAKLEEIADDILCFVRDMRKIMVKP
jgi:hypothetical protein